MDEEALRNMMPMSFGKVKKGPQAQAAAAAQQSASASTTPALQGIAWQSPTALALAASKAASSSAAPRGPIGPLKRPASSDSDDDDEEELDDDGLTREERQANREAERRAAERGGEDSDDEDSDGSVDLGPEPQSGPSGNDGYPVAERVELKDHSKTVSALAVDSTGTRVATGSYDYEIKLWDFGGMTSAFRPFKTFEPSGSYWVHDLAWSPSGDQLLVASGTTQPKVFDRDGAEAATYMKGDVYIRDMKNTKGHVAELTSCMWHPLQRNTFATASADSSVRIWDAEDRTKQQKVILVRSKERGTRTKVTSMAYSHDGRTLAAGCLDGALHLWRTNGSYVKPDSTAEGAHERNAGISSVVFSRDGKSLASRGCDGTVKLWDARSLKKPVASRDGLPNNYDQTSLIFSLDERSLLTGTSIVRAPTKADDPEGALGAIKSSGAIEVMSRDDLSPIRRISLGDEPTSVVRLHWSSKINQLFASTSSGSVSVYYDSRASTRGALLCIGKRAKNRAAMQSFDMPIITPHADPDNRGMGTSQAAKKRRLEKARQDTKATRMPDRPVEGRGKGGRIGAAATAHVVQDLFRGNTRDEDPREALLKYADTEKDPKWTKAWKANQPDPVFAKDTDEGGEEGGS